LPAVEGEGFWAFRSGLPDERIEEMLLLGLNHRELACCGAHVFYADDCGPVEPGRYGDPEFLSRPCWYCGVVEPTARDPATDRT